MPALCSLPALGLFEITLSGNTVDDLRFVILPTAHWACFNAVFAAASVRPVSFGTTQRLLICISPTVFSNGFATHTRVPSDDTP